MSISCAISEMLLDIGRRSPIFGRSFVKRFALCYRFVVCLSCLSVLSLCDVGVLWPNGWTDQDETWQAGRPRPRPHCVRWGPTPPLLKGHSPPPICGPYLLRPNGFMDQDATRHGARPRPRQLCVRWGPWSSLPKKGTKPPIFGPCFIVSKQLDRSRWYLAWM